MVGSGDVRWGDPKWWNRAEPLVVRTTKTLLAKLVRDTGAELVKETQTKIGEGEGTELVKWMGL